MREYWLDEMELSYNPDGVIDEICSLAKDTDVLLYRRWMILYMRLLVLMH